MVNQLFALIDKVAFLHLGLVKVLLPTDSTRVILVDLVWGSGFRVGFRIDEVGGLWFQVCEVWGLGFRAYEVWGLGFRAWALGLWGTALSRYGCCRNSVHQY